ncbi:hypothetical protein P4597_26960 [Peribacillus simplex]|uniref:hypothetical protein n=1 Tax=Peribacillus simplex TaxID=1478 RepID=UPI002E22C7F8|nr:hypothetical protein [Peribacillus simplex]
MGKNINLPKEDLIKEVDLQVLEVEESAIIVKVDGWRMRVYFENPLTLKEVNPEQMISVKYKGDIGNAHSIRFEKI